MPLSVGVVVVCGAGVLVGAGVGEDVDCGTCVGIGVDVGAGGYVGVGTGVLDGTIVISCAGILGRTNGVGVVEIVPKCDELWDFVNVESISENGNRLLKSANTLVIFGAWVMARATQPARIIMTSTSFMLPLMSGGLETTIGWGAGSGMGGSWGTRSLLSGGKIGGGFRYSSI